MGSTSLYIDDDIGVVSCCLKIGRLAEMVYKEIDEVVVFTANMFEYFNDLMMPDSIEDINDK
jgi:hypothetical protein